MKNLLLLLLVLGLALFCGCHKSSKTNCPDSSDLENGYIFPRDTSISSHGGWPKDSLTPYFPEKIKLYDTVVVAGLDKIWQDVFSDVLHSAKEPVLYNFPLKTEIFRWTYMHSFYLPLIVTLQRSNNHVWLTTKVLYMRRHEPVHKGLTLKLLDYYPYYYYSAKELSMKEWREAEKIIDRKRFLRQSPTIEEGEQIDGAGSIFEMHTKKAYWFTFRQPGVSYGLEALSGIILDTLMETYRKQHQGEY